MKKSYNTPAVTGMKNVGEFLVPAAFPAAVAVVVAVNEVAKVIGDRISAFAPEALQPCLEA